MKRSCSIFCLSVLAVLFIQVASLSAAPALYDRNKDTRKERQLQNQKKVESAVVPKPKNETPKTTQEAASKETDTKSVEEKNTDKKES